MGRGARESFFFLTQQNRITKFIILAGPRPYELLESATGCREFISRQSLTFLLVLPPSRACCYLLRGGGGEQWKRVGERVTQ